DIYKEMFNHQKQLALDAIDEEMNAYRKAHNEKIALIEEEADKEDFDKNLAKRQKEIQEIRSQIDLYSMDETQQARVADLREQLNDKEIELEEFLADRQRELRKKSLEEELANKESELNEKRDKTEQHFEDLLNDERNFARMREDILK